MLILDHFIFKIHKEFLGFVGIYTQLLLFAAKIQLTDENNTRNALREWKVSSQATDKFLF